MVHKDTMVFSLKKSRKMTPASTKRNSVHPQELKAGDLPLPEPPPYPPESLQQATSPMADTLNVEEPFAPASFEDKAIRHAFIRKVYLILLSQLLVTAAIVAFFLFHTPTKRWVQQHSSFYWVSYGIFLFTYISLVCSSSARRKHPWNFICLLVFTLSMSYITGAISSYYDTEIVLIAVGITAAVCLSVTIFAFQTRTVYSRCVGLMLAVVMVIFFFGVACLVVYFTIGSNFILRCVYGAIGALLFSLFLAWDTYAVVSDGDDDDALSPEEYIFAALQLYLDIIQILLCIMSMFGGGGGGSD